MADNPRGDANQNDPSDRELTAPAISMGDSIPAPSGYQPISDSYADAALSTDYYGNLNARAQVLTDEGSFREDFSEIKNQVLFRVEHFKINGNWACVMVTPLKNNIVIAEPRWDLFHKINGKWKTVDWSQGIDFQDDFELIDLPSINGRIAKLIVKKYPTCSMSIFGK